MFLRLFPGGSCNKLGQHTCSRCKVGALSIFSAAIHGNLWMTHFSNAFRFAFATTTPSGRDSNIRKASRCRVPSAPVQCGRCRACPVTRTFLLTWRIFHRFFIQKIKLQLENMTLAERRTSKGKATRMMMTRRAMEASSTDAAVVMAMADPTAAMKIPVSFQCLFRSWKVNYEHKKEKELSVSLAILMGHRAQAQASRALIRHNSLRLSH